MASDVIDFQRIDRMIHETEALKNYDKVKIERDHAKARIGELELKVRDYLQVMKERDEAQKKLTTLNYRAEEIIKVILEQMKKPKGQRQYNPEITATGLHSIIEYLIEEQVSQQVQAANSDKLVNEFREEVQKQVQDLLNSHAMKYFGKPEKVAALKQKQYEDPYVVLRKVWDFGCSKCHMPHELDLQTVGAVRELLSKKYVDVPIDYTSSGLVGEHSRHVTLADVVRSYLSNSIDDLPQAPT